MSRILSGFYAALAVTGVLLAASGAQAFTIENGDGGATGANLMAPSPFNGPAKEETDQLPDRHQPDVFAARPTAELSG
jgi:hypothetical protein